MKKDENRFKSPNSIDGARSSHVTALLFDDFNLIPSDPLDIPPPHLPLGAPSSNPRTTSRSVRATICTTHHPWEHLDLYLALNLKTGEVRPSYDIATLYEGGPLVISLPVIKRASVHVSHSPNSSPSVVRGPTPTHLSGGPHRNFQIILASLGQPAAMHPSFIVLLCLGLVRALLQNVTVDDTSPLIIYAGDTFQCNALTCGNETLAAGQFNESLTYTSGAILFNFTGVGYYATIQIFGVAAVSFEGEGVVFNHSDLNPANVRENVWAEGFNNTPHTLVIVPVVTNPSTIVGFESLVYTVSQPDKSNHVGAIVGGVIGGVALILVLSLAALLARRRKLILRRNQRKSVVLRGLALARQNQIGQVGSEEGVKDLAG